MITDGIEKSIQAGCFGPFEIAQILVAAAQLYVADALKLQLAFNVLLVGRAKVAVGE